MSLERLTIDIIRAEYWDPTFKIGKPVYLYAIQDYTGESTSDYESLIFIPDGSMIHENKRLGIHHRYDDWLSYNSSGPYTESDLGKSLDDFYYLSGRIKGLLGNDFEPYNLQICTRPLNILSTDCMNAIDCWIPISR